MKRHMYGRASFDLEAMRAAQQEAQKGKEPSSEPPLFRLPI